ncbi:MAG: radical SAM protein [Candidatus Geothermincolia bacterium]
MMDEPVFEGHKIIDLPTVHKAYLVEQTYGTQTVRCGVCAQRCEIDPDARGRCETRLNLEGQLYTLTYGDLLTCESRPVEIKPFYHFRPGKSMMTVSTASCNLDCPWCQNHLHSRTAPRPLQARHVPMREVADAAVAAGDVGICVSFTEPLMLFEYCLGLFREAGARKLDCAFVSNGYMTSDALHMLSRAGLNAMNVDIKGNDAVYREHCGAEAGALPAWETVKNALASGIHVEVVHLVVTGLNDNEESFDEVLARHLEYAGPAVPLHINAYLPAFEYGAPATKVEFLEEAHAKAKEAGVLFPYVGNVPGHRLANTYCPECGELLLVRSDGTLTQDLTNDFNCPSCGYSLPVVP